MSQKFPAPAAAVVVAQLVSDLGLRLPPDKLSVNVSAPSALLWLNLCVDLLAWLHQAQRLSQKAAERLCSAAEGGVVAMLSALSDVLWMDFGFSLGSHHGEASGLAFGTSRPCELDGALRVPKQRRIGLQLEAAAWFLLAHCSAAEAESGDALEEEAFGAARFPGRRGRKSAECGTDAQKCPELITEDSQGSLRAGQDCARASTAPAGGPRSTSQALALLEREHGRLIFDLRQKAGLEQQMKRLAEKLHTLAKAEGSVQNLEHKEILGLLHFHELRSLLEILRTKRIDLERRERAWRRGHSIVAALTRPLLQGTDAEGQDAPNCIYRRLRKLDISLLARRKLLNWLLEQDGSEAVRARALADLPPDLREWSLQSLSSPMQMAHAPTGPLPREQDFARCIRFAEDVSLLWPAEGVLSETSSLSSAMFCGDHAGVEKLREISDRFLREIWASHSHQSPFEMLTLGRGAAS